MLVLLSSVSNMISTVLLSCLCRLCRTPLVLFSIEDECLATVARLRMSKNNADFKKSSMLEVSEDRSSLTTSSSAAFPCSGTISVVEDDTNWAGVE